MLFQSTPPVKAATLTLADWEAGVLGFQSTPPVKAATDGVSRTDKILIISIHAAREGGDCLRAHGIARQVDFNPRRP